MDFGVARSLQNGNKRLTKTGSVVGTPYYAAPEQIRSQSNLINPRTDIYSLGVTLYELLSGTIPFEGKSEYDTLKMQVEEPLPPHPKISSKLFQIISKATAKDQKKRFKDAKAFQKELVPFLKISAKSTSNRNDVKNKRSSMSRVLNFIFIPLSIAFGVLFFITKGELDDLRWSYDYNQYTLSDNVTKLREQLDRSNKAFPFEIESIRIRALDYYDDNTVVYGYEDHLRGGQNLKLQSRISYRYYGDESVSAEIYYKIYDPNEKLVVGSAWDQNPVSTNVRYSYKNTMELLPSNQLETFTFGWFRSYWESGYYRIEFWYHDKCLGSKTFVLN
jgi:serine/threonine protein kinase